MQNCRYCKLPINWIWAFCSEACEIAYYYWKWKNCEVRCAELRQRLDPKIVPFTIEELYP